MSPLYQRRLEEQQAQAAAERAAQAQARARGLHRRVGLGRPCAACGHPMNVNNTGDMHQRCRPRPSSADVLLRTAQRRRAADLRLAERFEGQARRLRESAEALEREAKRLRESV